MSEEPSLGAAAAQLLERMSLVPPREPGDKLRPIDEAMILELAAAGKSQTEIAETVGCHQSTVSRTIAEWQDTCGLARKHAEAKSLEMMQRFVRDASPAEILKILAKLDVVRDDHERGGGSGITVIVNTQGHVIERPPDIVVPPILALV